MNTLEYVLNRYNAQKDATSPILLPHTRGDLPALFQELHYKTGVELGVMYGEYSKMLLDANKDLKLYCVDPWELYDDLPDSEAKSGNYRVRTKHGFEHATNLLKGYSCEFIRKFSMDAVKDFERESIDFVYIDANHTFDYVMEDIIEWTRIVRPGGIVSGHDFRCRRHREVGVQVSKAVLTYTEMHAISPLFLYDADGSSSWMFVKPS